MNAFSTATQRNLHMAITAASAGQQISVIDDDAAPRLGEGSASSHIQTLLSMLPLGFALADRDGRFLFLNEAFIRAAGLEKGAQPVYPSDLVVREDKATVADTVRRFASGPPMSGDIAVRLQARAEDVARVKSAWASPLRPCPWKNMPRLLNTIGFVPKRSTTWA